MEWLLLLFLFALSWYWWDGVGAKEIAVRQGKQLCQQADVVFLDDTVALNRLRLRRQLSGSIVFYRRFVFEFCTDGENRYSGYIDMMGRLIQQTHMDVYRVSENPWN